MDELFEKLKAEPPVNRALEIVSFNDISAVTVLSDDDEEGTKESSGSALLPRRVSIPPPNSTNSKRLNSKSRSLSPLTTGVRTAAIKPVKVLIARQKFDDSKVDVDKKNEANGQNKPIIGQNQILKCTQENKADELKIIDKNTETLKKSTPTKAQQKLFDPEVVPKVDPKVVTKVAKLEDFKIKRCRVRLQRQNLKALQDKLNLNAKSNELEKSVDISPKKIKRKVDSSPEEGSQSTKRLRAENISKKDKPKNQFFIKFQHQKVKQTPPKKDAQNISSTKEKTTKSRVKDKQQQKGKQNALAPKQKTKPTKISRTQLINTFGKRFLNCHVKMERCKHPLMLIFESNAKARRMQTKQNKAKNLTVSFKEQVEIIGNISGTDDDTDSDADFDITSHGSKSKATKTSSVNATGIAAAAIDVTNPLPARLKKVENGKVIDDIELDTSLFIDPNIKHASSTPVAHSFMPCRNKKREKKTYSVLKGDGTPSLRKEQLKLANEKLPPSGLRRLHIEEVDDEDDDEYIVPIEIPSRRNSNANSSKSGEAASPNDTTSDILPIDALVQSKELEIPAEILESSGSFVSAQDILDRSRENEIESAENNVKNSNTTVNTKADAEADTAATDTKKKTDINLETVGDGKHIENKHSLAGTEEIPSLNDLVQSMIKETANNTLDVVATDDCMTEIGAIDEDMPTQLLAEAKSNINSLNDVEMLESPGLPIAEPTNDLETLKERQRSCQK